MTVDRPQVGGGKIPVMPGTCEACVWGRGEHVKGCAKAWVGPHSLARYKALFDPGIDVGTAYFIAPRKIDEAEEEWLKRCGVIRGIGQKEEE